MKSVTKFSVMALLCWMVVGQAAADAPKEVQDYVSMYNGVYGDMDQIKGEQEKRDTIKITVMPINIQVTNGLTYYMAESLNGNVVRQEVHKVTFDSASGNINIFVWTIPESKRPDPKNVNPDDLEKLKEGDFQSDPECVCVFKKVGPGVYTGTRPDCRTRINGKYAQYSFKLTCDDISGNAPVTSAEQTTQLPYIFRRIGPRFPARNLPADYKGPCDESQ